MEWIYTTPDTSAPQTGLPQPSQTNQPVQNIVQPAQAQQGTLNPASRSFVPTQSVGSYTLSNSFEGFLFTITNTPSVYVI